MEETRDNPILRFNLIEGVTFAVDGQKFLICEGVGSEITFADEKTGTIHRRDASYLYDMMAQERLEFCGHSGIGWPTLKTSHLSRRKFFRR